MQAFQFEPMSVGGILDQTFRLYRRNFTRFLAIVAIVQVPLGLAGALLAAWAVSSSTLDPTAMAEMETGATAPEMPGSLGVMLGGVFLGLFLAMLSLTLCQAALVKAVSESYLGNDVSVGKAYRFILPKVLTIIGAGIIVWFLTVLGFFLLVVPGVIFIAWFALTTQAIVIENRGATAAIGRSKELTSGNRGKVLAVLMLTGLLSWIVSMAGDRLGGVLSTFAGDSVTATLVIHNVAAIAGGVLAAPISAAAMILLYYDLRIRKEGFDLQMLAERLGAEQPDHADDLSE